MFVEGRKVLSGPDSLSRGDMTQTVKREKRSRYQTGEALNHLKPGFAQRQSKAITCFQSVHHA